MHATEVCPVCGTRRPANAPGSLCPGCLLREGLDGDSLGLSPTGGPGSTVPMGGPEESVLETLARSVGPVPRVLLRDVGPDDPPSTVVAHGASAAPAPPGLQLHGEIARGGMGAVLKGRDPDLGRELAVKVLLERHHDDPDLVRRFVEEAQIAGQLQHPGIVPVYGLGAFSDARPYFTMKLVKGRTLSDLLAARPSPAADLPRFVGIIESVCQTVAYAHARGVIHRDLKPSNVMVGSFGEVQVMDWGLAKVLPRGGATDDARAGREGPHETLIATARSGSADADLSGAGSVLGTPPYMAPEQARGEIDLVDERADVFALGSILCEVLTGRPAFTGRGQAEVRRRAALGDTGEALARLDASLADAELIGLAKDCLGGEPEERPRDAGTVAARVTKYLAGVQDRLRAAELSRAAEAARAEEATRTAAAEAARAEAADHAASAAEARAAAERRARRLQLGLAATVLVAGAIGGLAWTAARLERDRHRSESDRIVGEALATAMALRDEAERAGPEATDAWARALDAAERAKGLAAARPPRDALVEGVASTFAAVERSATDVRERAGRAEIDRRLVADLDEARLRAAAGKEDRFDSGRKLAAYATAFRRAGIDLKGKPAAIAARLKSGRDVVRIAAALDDWSWEERLAGRDGGLDAAARAIDPERNPLRDAIAKGDRDAVLAMARGPSARRLPASTICLLATSLKGVGARDEAIALLAAARSASPADFWINHDLGALLMGQKTPAELGDAVRFLSVAAALRLDSPGARNNLGLALAAQGRHDEAIAAYREAIRLGSGDSVPRYNLANSLKDLERLDEAIAAYREAIRLRPDYPDAHNNLGAALNSKGRLDEAVAAYREAIRVRPDYPEAHNNLGVGLKDQGRLDEAIAACREAIRLRPDYPEAHHNLGLALVSLGEPGEATAAFREAIRLKPDLADAHCNLGVLLTRQGKLDEAVAACREAIRLKPDLAAAHANLGGALTRQGKLIEAAAACREAIRLNPDLAEAHGTLGVTLHAQRNLADAVASHREAIRLRPDLAEAHSNLGAALADQGKLAEAVAAHREAVRLGPTHAEAHYNLGNTLKATGDHVGATAAYREAIRLRPDFVEVQQNLGLALIGQGKPAEAIDAFREAIRLKPEHAKAHIGLGLALRSQGRFADALASLSRGHELGSKQPGWPAASTAAAIEGCKLLAALEARLPALLRGEAQPRDNAERLTLGEMCYDTGRYAASARFWGEALVADPGLGEDRRAQRRYNAACSAAMAGTGLGKDDPQPDDATRAALRTKARGWLREELAAWSKAIATSPKEQPRGLLGLFGPAPVKREDVEQTLAHWKADADLAGVRDEAMLLKLPEAERKEWQALWVEVDTLLAKVHPPKP